MDCKHIAERDLYIERMGNGLTFVRDRYSGLTCTVDTATGRHHSGDLIVNLRPERNA